MAEFFQSKPTIQLLHRLFSEFSNLKILAFIWTLDTSFNSHIAFVSKKAKLTKKFGFLIIQTEIFQNISTLYLVSLDVDSNMVVQFAILPIM